MAVYAGINEEICDRAIPAAIIQIIFTMGAGLFFAGIYLRTGSISLAIVIHMLHDLLSFIVETLPAVETVELTVNDVLSLLVNVLPFVFGILMLLIHV